MKIKIENIQNVKDLVTMEGKKLTYQARKQFKIEDLGIFFYQHNVSFEGAENVNGFLAGTGAVSMEEAHEKIEKFFQDKANNLYKSYIIAAKRNRGASPVILERGWVN